VQKGLLATRVSARKSREQNWYTIFEILFPGTPKPRSPYIDPDFADGLLALREYAAVEMEGIIAQASIEQMPNLSLPLMPLDFNFQSYTEAVVRHAIDILFSRFESRMPRVLARPPTASDSHPPDSGYSGSRTSGIINTQSTQVSIDPTLPSSSISEGPFGDMFTGYMNDIYDSVGGQSIYPTLF
jgi:hypothetical protein